MLKDYHSHTFRCKHASGEVIDYATVAAKQGLQVLGVSDHTPSPDGRWNTLRMSIAELDSYDAAIESARKAYPELTILKGMECEYIEEFLDFYQEELLEKRKFDYLIAGSHFFLCRGKWTGTHSYIKSREELEAYANNVIASMASGLFAFIAHPDLFGNSYELWDEHTLYCSKLILEAAVKYKIPLEVNAYGFRKRPKETAQGTRPPYPLTPFWELAAEYDGLSVIANSDAHQPEEIGCTAEALALINKYKLKLADLSYLERKAPLSCQK